MSRAAVRRSLLLLVTAAALAAAPAGARAGTYHVYACAAGGGSWGNLSWRGDPVSGMVVDTNCTPPGLLIGLRIDGGKAIANGARASIAFTSPPGTAIADFSISRQLDFNSNPPLKDTRPLYAIYQLGDTVFAGAGDYDNATRNRLKTFGSWYGHPQGDAGFSRRTTTMGEFGALPAMPGPRGRSRCASAASAAPRAAPPRPPAASTTCSTGST